jgi:ATP-dependent Lhr-like helicase
LRKRFCRQFNFELQAAANEDAIVLSLGETHSFALAEVAHYLSSRTVKQVLTQAVLAAPLFTTRWRWVVTTALAVKRYRGGRKNPPPLQRMEAEDLIAVVFPDQIACAENIQGEREIPDHPLVNQVLADCLTEAMDGDGLEKLLQGIESGTLTVIARDLPHPSPLSQEILNAKPYGFLDDAPLEERRTQAVMSRRWLDPIEAKEFGALDAQAIVRVREEAVPAIESAEELHDALLSLTLFIPEPAYQGFFEELVRQSRIAVLQTAETKFWVAAERLPVARALFPDATFSPTVETPAEFLNRAWTAEEAVVELVRGHLQSTGPVTALILARQLKQDGPRIEAALLALENEGFVLRGQFTPGTAETEWCERRLLARIHRYTVERLRADIEPVPAADFLRFLFSWHGIANEPKPEGAEALYGVLEKLEGFEAQASSIETDLLPARLSYYNATDLDSLTLTGRISWARLTQPKSAPDKERAANLARTTPIAFLLRSHQRTWQALQAGSTAEPLKLSFGAQRIFDLLKHEGALFLQDLVAGSGLLKAQTEEALSELVAQGLVHADSFASLRALILPADKRRARRHTSRRAFAPLSETGRWSLWRRPFATTLAVPETVEVIARTLLKRYGVVFKRLLAREAGCLPSWYDLLQVYRRLEARGDLRGGRFVAGMSGEQFALPEAVATLRHVRKEEKTGRWVSLSAADPLNLIGILTPGARVSAIAGNRVLYRDGVPIAAYVGAQTQFLSALDDTLQWEAQTALRRVPASARTKHGASLPV